MKKVEKIMFNVNISTAENGYIVEVGCAKFVFEHVESLLAKLEDYLTSPADMIKIWKPEQEVEVDPDPEASYRRAKAAIRRID